MGKSANTELLEDELKALVRAGGYGSEREAVGHAVEVLLAANPSLRVSTAVELYRQGRVTLARAAEIAGQEWEEFRGRLAEKQVPLEMDASAEDIQASVDVIHRLRQAQ
jgi:predicted HTH domain antitoxin